MIFVLEFLICLLQTFIKYNEVTSKLVIVSRNLDDFLLPSTWFYVQVFRSKCKGFNASVSLTGKIVGKIDTHKKIPQVQKCLLMPETFLMCT